MVRMDLQRILKPKIKPRSSQQKLKEENVYTVVVMANAAAVRNRLDTKTYELHINEDCLSLHSITNKKQVVSWPCFYIRRYGPDGDKFHFEAGRKCQTGEGLFSLKCYPGEAERIHYSLKQIFNKLQAQKLSDLADLESHAPTRSYTSVFPRQNTSNCTEITSHSTSQVTAHVTSQEGRSETSTISSIESDNSDDDDENSPELPPRKYRTDTKSFKQMLERIQAVKQENCKTPTKPTKKVQFQIQPQSAQKSKCRSPQSKLTTKQRQLSPTEINEIIRQHRDTLLCSELETTNNNEKNYTVLNEMKCKKVSGRTNIYDEVIYEE